MNRDHALFGLIGLLFGFIAGYMMHEVMAARQPPRLRAAVTANTASFSAGQAAVPPAAGGGPAMLEIQALQRRLESDPDDAQALLRLANLNYDIQAWERARDLYERYLSLESGDPDVITDLGVCLRQIGDFRRAMETFLRAKELQPDHWQSRYNLVIVLAFDLEDLPRARQELVELRSMQPDNPEVERLAAELESRSRAA